MNPGASIQIDGAARLIRQCHNSTSELHDARHFRFQLSNLAEKMKHENYPQLDTNTFKDMYTDGCAAQYKCCYKSIAARTHAFISYECCHTRDSSMNLIFQAMQVNSSLNSLMEKKMR